MASGKSSYLLFLLSLILIISAFVASAHRPLVVEASEPTTPRSAHSPLVVEASEPTTPRSAHSPLVVEASEPTTPRSESDGGMNRNGHGNSVKPSAASIGTIPIPIPGVDGGFHFDLGPIGFGGSWQWGVPGYVVYSQPYVVVSPYSQPYALPAPYTGSGSPYQQPGSGSPYQKPGSGLGSPYQQPGSGYGMGGGQPNQGQSGFGQPSPGSYGGYVPPSDGYIPPGDDGYAQGSNRN